MQLLPSCSHSIVGILTLLLSVTSTGTPQIHGIATLALQLLHANLGNLSHVWVSGPSLHPTHFISEFTLKFRAVCERSTGTPIYHLLYAWLKA